MKLITLFLIVATSVLVSLASNAHNKVVVVPLLGSDGGSDISGVITVAKSGGDFNGLIGAMNSISDASESKPYLIYVGPGRFNVPSTVAIKPYVSITGSGKNSTTLVASMSSASAPLFKAGKASTISDLRVELTQNAANRSTGFLSCPEDEIGCADLDSVSVKVSSSASSSIGVLTINYHDLTVTNSEIIISSQSGNTNNDSQTVASLFEGSLRIVNSTISSNATKGVLISGIAYSSVSVKTSTIKGKGDAVFSIDGLSGGFVSQSEVSVFGGGAILYTGGESHGFPYIKIYNSLVAGPIEASGNDGGQVVCFNSSNYYNELNQKCEIQAPAP